MSRAGVQKDANSPAGAWLVLFRRYLLWTGGANLAWEMAHLPLYAVWETGTLATIAWLLVRCTIGDFLIALSSLMLALVLLNCGNWPRRGYRRVAGVALAVGLAYTLFSEWYNTTVSEVWAYSDPMPMVPVIDIGLSPIAQWIVVPLIGFCWAQQAVAREAGRAFPSAARLNAD